MTNRTIFLSGYPANALAGRIEIASSLMRYAPELRARHRKSHRTLVST
jgi:hypothetical protein